MAIIKRWDDAGYRTLKTIQLGRRIEARDIPLNATHVIWFEWSHGKTVIQYADTKRSAVIAYNKAEPYVGYTYNEVEVVAAGWDEISPNDRQYGKAL